MKKPILFLSLICALFALNGFAPEARTAPAMPYITFMQPGGVEVEKNIHQIKCGEWSMPIVSVEFRKNNEAVALEGLLVNVPREGDATIRNFSGNEALTEGFKNAVAEGVIKPGHRIIIDNLRVKGEKGTLAPMVYSALE